jgi:large repetitive protein
VTVTDANGCVATATYTIVQETSTLTLSAAITPTICTAEIGAIDLTVEGGTPEYTFAWTGPDEFTADTEDITDLAAGDYIVTVTDANGCVATATYTLFRNRARHP